MARLISAVAAPAPVASTLLLGVACYRAPTLAQGLVLGALLAVCATLPPTLSIKHPCRRDGRRESFSLPRSSDRLPPLASGCASVIAAAALVHTFDAPRELNIVLLTMLLVLGLLLAATPLSRVSVHTAAVAGSSVLLHLLFGAVGIALLPIVALVGWSRLELGEHTPAQVLAGAFIGGVGASVAYGLVR
jgi:membrane-associated phospholipid phosphatase